MEKYKVGDTVDGVVTGIESYGIFLSLDDNVTGLIHISEISNAFVRNVKDYAEINEKLKAKIIGIDDSNKRLKLSIKEFNYKNIDKYRHKIVETKSGFSTLEKQLNVWINDKIEEINKKN